MAAFLIGPSSDMMLFTTSFRIESSSRRTNLHSIPGCREDP
jgi:hypothetical protein